MIGSVQGPWGVNVQSREYRHVDTRLKTGTLLYFTLLNCLKMFLVNRTKTQ